MEKYTYKSSDIEWLGEIPEHWKVDRLKFYDKIIMGQSPKSSYVNQDGEGTPFLQGNTEFGKLNPIHKNWCTSGPKLAIKGDLLLSVRASLGDLNISDKKYIIGRGLCAIRSWQNNDKFIYYYLSILSEYFSSIATGTTFFAIKTRDVENLKTPLPPKQEQIAIANYLDQACERIDRIIAIKEEQLNKLDKSLQLKLNEIFYELEKTVVNYKKMKVVVNTTKGFAFKSALFEDKGHPIVKASDIKNGSINKSKTFINDSVVEKFNQVALLENDIVISTVGSQARVENSAVGQLAYVNKSFEGALLNQNTVILRINYYFKVIPMFLYLQLKTSKYREHLDQYARGTANQASLMLVDILNYKICIPTEDKQELTIANINSYSEKLMESKKKIKLQIKTLKAYRKSLIHECVTGKKQVTEKETKTKQTVTT
tara:strand:- start:7469 stop:8752 length:1284 start_codon:yes stop_codon:yes gene_type:complete